MKNLKNGRKLAPVFIILALVIACQTAGRAVYGGLGRASDPVPFMEKLRTGTLPSGLRYYILENSMPEGRAFLTLSVDAGSVLETEEEQGLAHFVEHMAFNGTERFPFSKAVEALIKGHEESVQNNSTFCTSYANSAVIFRSPLSRLDRWPALWQAVTVADMQRTMARLLSGGGVRMVLYPE